MLSSLLLAAALATAPGAGLVGPTCEAGGTQVSLAAPPDRVASFTVAVDGAVRWNVTLGPGDAVHIPVRLPEGTSRVAIRAAGMPDLDVDVAYACEDEVRFSTQPVFGLQARG